MTFSEPHRPVLFVGLGAIGLPMAMQLVKAGYEVTGIDVSSERRDAVRDCGIAAVGSIADAPSADVAIVTAANASQVELITFGAGELFDLMPAESSCVIMSILGPNAIERLVEQATAKSIGLVGPPVSGGVSGAEQGRLVIFAAGESDQLARTERVLAVKGTVHQCGTRVCQGQSFKLINQLLCSVHLFAAAEALSLAEQLGLDSSAVHEMVAHGGGASWMWTDRGAGMTKDQDGAAIGPALDIFVKDSDLVVQAANDVGFTAPLVTAANSAFHTAAARALVALMTFEPKTPTTSQRRSAGSREYTNNRQTKERTNECVTRSRTARAQVSGRRRR